MAHYAIAQRLTMAHGVRGGMETQSRLLAEGLATRGHDPLVLTTPHPDGLREGHESNVAVRYVSPGTWRRCTPQWWEACYATLAQMHRACPFDVLISQCDGALGYIPQAAVDLRLPCVVIRHGSLIGELRTRWRDARTMRGAYRLVRFLKTQPHLFLLWRKAAPMVKHWVIVSHETANDVQRELGIDHARITVVRNGIDTDHFRPDAQARSATRRQLGIPEDAPVLLTVGRLEYEKGFHIAIQALRVLRTRFPTMRLLIVGDGVYGPTLRRMATGLDDAVIFAGYVPNAALPPLFAAADLFVMPTLRDEGLPMNVIEALASGLPVIASRAGGIPSAIDDGQTGLLVPMGQGEALTHTIQHVLREQSLYTSMATAARQAALTHFSQAHMVEATERVLMNVV